MKKRIRNSWSAVLATLLLAVTICAQRSDASTLLVYNTNDSGAGSLRQAILNNAFLGGGNTILFSNVVTGTITLSSGELFISNDVTIVGPGANVLAAQAIGFSRVFHITNATVSISGLTITNGNETSGGGIYNNSATLTLSNCTVSGNSSDGEGGGIYHLDQKGNTTLSIIACTFSGNGTFDAGGGIYSICTSGSTTVSVTNSTFSGNTATHRGGGIYNNGGNGQYGTFSVTACTFSSNSASSGGGIYNDFNTALTIANTILKAGTNGANIFSDFSFDVNSLGFNLCSDNGDGVLTALGDQINTDPMLGPLQDNGGPTPTIMPLSNSPAIDQGKSFGLTTDQRGALRPYIFPSIPKPPGGDGSDIGALEVQGVGPEVFVTNTNDSGAGSLRQALSATNTSFTVFFLPNVTGTITLTSGELLISNSVTILGPGANMLAVSGNNASRIFDITNGIVSISGLMIRDGRVTGATGRPAGQTVFGGGLYCATPESVTLTACVISNCAAIGGNGASNLGGSGFPAGSAYGGGIYNILGNLTLDRCWVVNNVVAGGHGGSGGPVVGSKGGNGGSGFGGGILQDAEGGLTLVSSTVSSNLAIFGSAGSGPGGSGVNGTAGGAGLYQYSAPVNVSSSTIASNSVNGGGTGSGGGINNSNFGSLSLFSCTVAANNGDSAGGGIYGSGAAYNSIIAYDTAAVSPDVSGTFTSQGYNLIANPAGNTNFNQPGDQVLVDPTLGPLQDNGGPTPTMALLWGSPAIDKGNGDGTTLDQRGAPRPFDFPSVPNAPGGDGSDIGAYELNIPSLNIALSGTNSVLSWSTFGTGFRLQSATNLTPPVNWSNVSAAPLVFSNQFYLTNPVNAPQTFYRLVNP